jgi:hypothetical protein
MDYLAEHYQPQAVSRDQRMQGEVCTRYRLDCVYESAFRTLILEVDENQHKHGQPYECDERRMGDLASEIPGVPCVFVRWNPDKYRYNRRNATEDGKIVDHALYKRPCHPLRARLTYLKAHLEKIDAVFEAWDGVDVASLPDWVRPQRANLVVHYLYYDRDTDSCARSEGIQVNSSNRRGLTRQIAGFSISIPLSGKLEFICMHKLTADTVMKCTVHARSKIC